MAPRISVFVIQDKAVIRAGLSALIKQQADLELVGESGSHSEAIETIRTLKPKVILMDLRSITAEELDAPNSMRESCPETRIVMLIDNDEGEVFASLAAEADGYCLREAEFEQIYTAIRTVASGEFWLDSAIARKVVKALLDTIAILSTEPEDSKTAREQLDLSPRELEVLGLVSKGLSNQKIAERLKISSETVKTHIRHIMKKLVVSDRTQAAIKAFKRGLI